MKEYKIQIKYTVSGTQYMLYNDEKFWYWKDLEITMKKRQANKFLINSATFGQYRPKALVDKMGDLEG